MACLSESPPPAGGGVLGAVSASDFTADLNRRDAASDYIARQLCELVRLTLAVRAIGGRPVLIALARIDGKRRARQV